MGGMWRDLYGAGLGWWRDVVAVGLSPPRGTTHGAFEQGAPVAAQGVCGQPVHLAPIARAPCAIHGCHGNTGSCIPHCQLHLGVHCRGPVMSPVTRLITGECAALPPVAGHNRRPSLPTHTHCTRPNCHFYTKKQQQHPPHTHAHPSPSPQRPCATTIMSLLLRMRATAAAAPAMCVGGQRAATMQPLRPLAPRRTSTIRRFKEGERQVGL